MKDLTKTEREFLKSLLKLKTQNHNGYSTFTKNKKHYKRSRVLMQLHLDKKLEIWEIVHHKDKNKENDAIENLEIMDTKNFNNHASLHIAGKRKKG
jgi:predicted metal-dependent TIM-barrel fold hydrolase